jgi:Domain of unknown function (DUF362)
MSENSHCGRRNFLKTAAAGAVGLSVLKFDRLFAQTTGGWVSGMQINSAIDNKRVICCHDTNMLTATPPNTTWANQNVYANATVIAANMDQMAIQLAQKATAADAWSTIFRSSKPWASTRVAIKTNAVDGVTMNHPRVAVIKKVCDVLVDQLGVQPANIVVYDGGITDAAVCYASYASLTDATKIRAVVTTRADALNGFKSVALANAQGGKAISCVADLFDGVIDILVNISVCKMHDGTAGRYEYGSVTLAMKNHLGTFINFTSTTGTTGDSTGLHSLNAIFEINKHPAILGGTPVRQQLCIVDSLLACALGPGVPWDCRPDRLVMGTFAPIVDYLTAKNIALNKSIMNLNATATAAAATTLPQFLTSFGYSATDALQWIEYVPGSSSSTGGTTGSNGGTTAAGGMTGNGGTTATGGTTGAGGTSRPGETTSTGGTTASGGTTGTGGTFRTGGTTATGGSSDVGPGGNTAAGGTTSAGGSMMGSTAASSSAGETGGIATSATSASSGPTATGGTVAGAGTTANSAGGNSGSSETAGASVTGAKSGSGCTVAGVDRRATRWGAMLALGAVVAEKLRRLVSGGDRSS